MEFVYITGKCGILRSCKAGKMKCFEVFQPELLVGCNSNSPGGKKKKKGRVQFECFLWILVDTTKLMCQERMFEVAIWSWGCILCRIVASSHFHFWWMFITRFWNWGTLAWKYMDLETEFPFQEKEEAWIVPCYVVTKFGGSGTVSKSARGITDKHQFADLAPFWNGTE